MNIQFIVIFFWCGVNLKTVFDRLLETTAVPALTNRYGSARSFSTGSLIKLLNSFSNLKLDSTSDEFLKTSKIN